MSLDAFANANTAKARTTAIAAFKRMLEAENVSMELVQASILLDSSGKRLAATMDRFGFYLATNESKKGKLARNSATSYYRNVKLWLFDEYPHLRVPTELVLLKQSKTLDKHCLKREKGGLINKAPPCTKEHLQSLIRYVYSTTRVYSDYQDAALACLMWHCFGRSSDLGYIQKQHVPVSASGTFYLRLLRVKTSEEQGLPLIPDKSDFLTCPLHALAVALATQDAPCAALLDQLPELASEDAAPLDTGAPLHAILEAEPATIRVAVLPTPPTAAVSEPVLSSTLEPSNLQPVASLHTSTDTQAETAPTKNKARTGDAKRGEDGAQAYVNRMLKRVAEPAGATTALTSHSFRRGGAQHASGDDRLAAQWIFDRGAWDMTKTNKAFAYITNTAREDRKVAWVLSGWGVDESPTILDVAGLDYVSQERLGRLQGYLFSSCAGLKQQRLNVSSKVISVLTAYLVRYDPQLKELAPTAPIVTRVEKYSAAAEIPTADMLAWSVMLHNETAPPAEEQEQAQAQDAGKHACPKMGHLLAVIQELIATNKALAARLTLVEAAQLKPKEKQGRAEGEHAGESSDQESKPKRRKKQATHLSTTWFEWYTRVPRVWASTDRQKKSESRHVVAFMKLFLVGGFTLDAKADDYKDQVLNAGRRAEDAVLKFLKARSVNAKETGSVLRALRPLHKSGVLDERIVAYKRQLAIGSIADPAPVDTQDILAAVGHV